jgi:ATP phosphoribosyltransferase regulatory subunit
MSAHGLRTNLDAIGARWVTPSVLQPAGLYLELIGEDIRRRAFMIVSDDGEELCLRPDMTVPACRLALSAGLTPGVLAYEGLVFRQQAAASAKETEFVQIGAEWCGFCDDAAAIDAQVLDAALAGVRAHGVEPKLRLGDVGLVLALAHAFGWSPAWIARLARGFRRSGGLALVLDEAGRDDDPAGDGFAASLEGLSALEAEARVAAHLAENGVLLIGARGLSDIAVQLLEKAQAARGERPGAAASRALRAALDIDAEPDAALARIEQTLAGAIDPQPAQAAIAQVRARLAAMTQNHPAQTQFSAAFGRGLAYYDGFVFDLEIPALGERASLGGGGRYDGLLADLAATAKAPHCALTAAGFALRPQRLADAGGQR